MKKDWNREGKTKNMTEGNMKGKKIKIKEKEWENDRGKRDCE